MCFTLPQKQYNLHNRFPCVCVNGHCRCGLMANYPVRHSWVVFIVCSGQVSGSVTSLGVVRQRVSAPLRGAVRPVWHAVCMPNAPFPITTLGIISYTNQSICHTPINRFIRESYDVWRLTRVVVPSALQVKTMSGEWGCRSRTEGRVGAVSHRRRYI